jgi:cbb3-type cytochrome oxidase maturation protein
MTNLVILIPVALLLGGLGLLAFVWCLKSNQFDDLDGAAQRILIDEDPPPPPVPRARREGGGHG